MRKTSLLWLLPVCGVTAVALAAAGCRERSLGAAAKAAAAEDSPSGKIARDLNENYVVIKVDREERPDVDAIYMNAVQMLTGSDGWPMTVWLTPDRRPFYGGTYFPAHDGDRGARVGFITLLKKLRELYNTKPEQIAQAARQLVQSIQSVLGADRSGHGLPDAQVSAARG